MEPLFEACTRKGIHAMAYMNITIADIENHILQLVPRPDGTRWVLFCVIDDTSELVRLRSRPDITVFRTSVYASKMSPNERVLPYVFEPPPVLAPKQPAGQPCVSFCGLAASHPDREACILALAKDPRIECNLILRGTFWGGKPNDPELFTAFVKNMEASEFNLCVRGRGNFSMRFYQTLSAGRIPVLLDTDMPLPFADQITWRDICVVSKSPTTMADDICTFWATHDIVHTQRLCAEIADRYFGLQNVGDQLLACLS